MYPWERARQFPQTFLYLRTPTAIEHSEDLLEALYEDWVAQGWGDAVELAMPIDGGTWENGFVAGVHLYERPADIAEALARALQLFDGWGIINTRRERAEWVAEGPISSFFNTRGASSPRSVAQIFLGFDNERFNEEAVDELRNVYGPVNCVPVFHFRDGRILLLNSSDPARLIKARLQRAMRRIEYVCGCAGDGEPFAKNDEAIWELVNLRTLSFSAPDDDV
jgi:hypothetical protein